MMECDLEIKEIIQRLHACDIIEGAQRISTSCLYPDGSRVVVFAYRGLSGAGYIVTDDGDAYETLRSYGIETKSKHTRQANETADSYGLKFDEKTCRFYTEPISSDRVATSIVYLANCIQAFVKNIVSRRQMDHEKDLADRIDECLKDYKQIPKQSIIRNYGVVGQSGKHHEFSHAIIQKNRSILIAPVSNHHASIAPAYMKFNDISQEHPNFKREAVISNASEWNSNDITLLSGVINHLNYIEDGLKPFAKRYDYLDS